jgi:hypothetical protein
MSKTDKKLGEQFKETFMTRKRKREDGTIQECYDKITAICQKHLDKDFPGCRIPFTNLGDLKDKSIREGVIKMLKENKFDAGENWIHGSNCGDNDCGSDCGPTEIFVSWDGTNYKYNSEYDKLPVEFFNPFDKFPCGAINDDIINLLKSKKRTLTALEIQASLQYATFQEVTHALTNSLLYFVKPVGHGEWTLCDKE